MIWLQWMRLRLRQSLAAASLLSLAIATPVLSQQQVLNSAEVYRLRNSVQLLLRNQSPRPARVSDRLAPQDSLRTALNSVAELLFNEGSIARVDQNTTFRFESGMRRFQLPNRVAMNETIFVLESGVALIISPPDSVGTEVQTPEGQINILPASEISAIAPTDREALAFQQPVLVAMRLTGGDRSPGLALPNFTQLAQTGDTPDSDSTNLLPPPARSSAVMVVQNAGVAQVFALTDGSISVSDRTGHNAVDLAGGEVIAVTAGQLGQVQEFDLEAFYQNVPLAAGLGPGQEALVAQESASVQASLNAVRPATLAAVRSQANRQSGFTSTFLQDALGATDRDFDGQRGEPSFVIINPQVTTGTFTFRDDNTAFFVPDGNEQPTTRIDADFDDRTIRINRQSGISNNAGLSGNRAAGTVVFPDGQAIRIELLGVNGRQPRANDAYRGSLTTGIAPDR